MWCGNFVRMTLFLVFGANSSNSTRCFMHFNDLSARYFCPVHSLRPFEFSPIMHMPILPPFRPQSPSQLLTRSIPTLFLHLFTDPFAYPPNRTPDRRHVWKRHDSSANPFPAHPPHWFMLIHDMQVSLIPPPWRAQPPMNFCMDLSIILHFLKPLLSRKKSTNFKSMKVLDCSFLVDAWFLSMCLTAPNSTHIRSLNGCGVGKKAVSASQLIQN